jgi:hypothetical protein
MMAAFPRVSATTYQRSSDAEFWQRSKASKSREASNDIAKTKRGYIAADHPPNWKDRSNWKERT